jgi:putative ABC transport system substrate-binding protein
LRLLGASAAARLLRAYTAQAEALRRLKKPERMRRVGVLMGFAESDHGAQSWVAGFREELQKLRWTEGRNIEHK